MKQTKAVAGRTTVALALLGAFFAGSTALAAPVTGSATVQNDGAVYLELKETAVARNFPDQNGSPLATVPAGTMVRAFRSSSGKPVFREVEIGGGFPVWVYGAFLQQTDVSNVLLVTGSRVNMRPLPELSASAMALRSKLDSGDRVLMLARANKSALFSEDWVRILAPVNSKAWIAASALGPVERAMGKLRWSEANKPLPTKARSRAGARAKDASASRQAASRPSKRKAASASPVAAGVIQQLLEADEAFAAAGALKTTTVAAWMDVVDGYEAVIAAAPASSLTHAGASARLEDAKMKLHVAELRDEFGAKRERRDEELRQLNDYLDKQDRKRSARWDRYEERGWLESRNVGGQKRWYLVFAGNTVAEVRCMSARYRLEVFDGFEIGVIGHEVVPVVQATQTSMAEARVVDIQRIEVISAKARR